MPRNTLTTRVAVGAFLALVWAAVGLALEALHRPGTALRWGEVEQRGADHAEMVFIPAGPRWMDLSVG